MISARLGLSLRESKDCYLVIGSLVNPLCNLGVLEPWSLEWLTGNVDDPLAWCGAAATPLCGEEDPSLSGETSR